MHRADVMGALARARHDEVVVVGPGSASGALYATGHRPATLYNMEMGYASAVCLGLALGDPDQRVVAVEGDGSLLAGMGVLSTIARYRPANLVVLVLDNGRYASCGSGWAATATDGVTDLAAVARACGIAPDRVLEVSDVDGAAAALEQALSGAGPWVVVAAVEPVDEWPDGRAPLPGHDYVETSVALRRELMRRREP